MSEVNSESHRIGNFCAVLIKEEVDFDVHLGDIESETFNTTACDVPKTYTFEESNINLNLNFKQDVKVEPEEPYSTTTPDIKHDLKDEFKNIKSEEAVIKDEVCVASPITEKFQIARENDPKSKSHHLNLSSKSKKKRKTLSLKSKVNIIKDCESGMKICELSKKFHLSGSTVRTIVKNKEEILAAVKNAHSLDSSIIRKRHGIIAEMETILKLWCDQVGVKNCPIAQSTVCYQAKQIFERLKAEAGEVAKDVNFVASNGWFKRFRTRFNLQSIRQSREVASTDKEAERMIEKGGYMHEEVDTSDSAPPEKLMTIASLTEGLDLIEKGLQILGSVDCNEERVTAIRQEIKKSLACYEEILREKQKSLCRQTRLLDFMK